MPQYIFPDFGINKEDLTSPIPDEWDLKTARCGLRPREAHKCGKFDAAECPRKCRLN